LEASLLLGARWPTVPAAKGLALLVCVLLALGASWAPVATAAPGDLDGTFGSAGIVTSGTGSPVDVAVQTDGKIVTAGSLSSCTPSGEEEVCHSEFLVERFNSDGSLDTSFGGGDGIVTTSFGKETQGASAVVIEPGGKILAGGQAEGEFALARYNSDGSLDTSFGGGDGEVTAAVPNTSGFQTWSGSMALLPSGKIVLGGNVYANEPEVNEPWHMALARFTASGSLDTSFGTNGIAIGPLGNTYGLTADASGRILVAGWSSYQFTVVRFTAEGNLDTSFANAGMRRLSLDETGSKADDVLVQPDGKILASGYGELGNMTIVRLNEDGTLDTSFGGGDGIAAPSFSLSCCPFGAAIALALQPDGRIVFVGQWNPEEGTLGDEWAVGRLYANGSLDKSFGGNGLVTNAFKGRAYENFATGVALQTDGKIVAVGTSGYPDYDFGMMRFLGDGATAEPTFDQVLVTKAGSGSGRVNGPELHCGLNCGANYEAGEAIELFASEESGSTFAGWSGACSGTGPCEVTMNSDRNVTATFTRTGSEEKRPGGEERPPAEEHHETPGNPPPTGPAPTPEPTKPKKRLLKCHRGFAKRRVHGKAKCVKTKQGSHSGAASGQR
jgi:uncharacterized delta-60 repeat protein